MAQISLKNEALLSYERFNELFQYYPSTGKIVRRVSRQGYNCKAGTVVGTMLKNGYLTVSIDKKSYLCHRIAWLAIYGEWPTERVDHKNGVRHDNRKRNLRQGTNTFNGENRREAISRKKKQGGLLGVYSRPDGAGYYSQISSRGVNYYLGSFKTSLEASQAYVRAKRKIHAGCTI